MSQKYFKCFRQKLYPFFIFFLYSFVIQKFFSSAIAVTKSYDSITRRFCSEWKQKNHHIFFVLIFWLTLKLKINSNLKKRLRYRCFPVTFAKFRRTRFYRTPLDNCFCIKWTLFRLPISLTWPCFLILLRNYQYVLSFCVI